MAKRIDGKAIAAQIKQELKHKYDQVYIEIIPD